MSKKLIVLPFLFFIAGYFLPAFFFTSPQLITPSLTGKSLPDALLLATTHKIGVQVVAEHEDILLPAGTVLQQSPLADEPIKRYQNIMLHISKKPPVVFVPYLIGKKEQEISLLASSVGAVIDKVSLPSMYPSIFPIAQYPAPGTALDHKVITTYIPQARSLLYVMPHLVGLTYHDVMSILHQVHLDVQIFYQSTLLSIDEQHGDAYVITAQRPLAGTIIDIRKPPIVQCEVQLS